jgi:hypothetical protein
MDALDPKPPVDDPPALEKTERSGMQIAPVDESPKQTITAI